MPLNEDPAALITMFSPLPGGGASARSLYALARLMRRRMHVDVIAPRRRGQRYTESNGEGRVYRVPLGGVDYGPEAEGRFLRAVQRQLRAQIYDVIVVGDPLSALAARHAGVEGLRIVYCLREIRSAEVTDFAQRLHEALGAVDKIVVPSRGAVQALQRSGIDKDLLEIVPPYLELRSLIATESVALRRSIVLLGSDRPERLVSVAAQLLDEMPPEWSLVVPSDGGQTREELKMLGEGYDALRLELPLAWPPRRLSAQFAKGGVAITLGRDGASAELDLPAGDDLMARSACLPVVTMGEDTSIGELIDAAKERLNGALVDPLITEDWPRLSDLLAQWAGVMGVSPRLIEAIDSQEPTSSDSHLSSGTATRTDWVETDLSRVDLSSSTHELSGNTGVHSE
jgi:hypothetical protein